MTYSNSQNDRKRPGRVEDEDGLNQMETNLQYHAGTDAGQTEIVTEAPIAAIAWHSSHATNFDSVKDYDSTPEGGSNVAQHIISSENIDSPSEITDETEIQVNLSIEKADGSSSQALGNLTFTRLSEHNGRVDIASMAYSADAAVVSIGPDGYVGIRCGTPNPAYPLDVPTGAINVTGDYLRDGSPINDWTVVGGAVTWAGSARVYHFWESTVATGTAPLDFTSETECPNLDAQYLKGRGWHQGVEVHGDDTYGSGQTNIASYTLATDAGAVWECIASVSVDTDTADAGLDVTIDLYDGDGANVFSTRTLTVEAVNTSFGGYSGGNAFSRLIFGTFTSATGSETLHVRVGVSGGTGSTAEATFILHRVR